MSSQSIADPGLVALFGEETASEWPPGSLGDERPPLLPADEVIARHCESQVSGTLYIDGEPPVRVYLEQGLVYFAERTTDAELGLRLVRDGVIDEEQLARGSRLLEGGRHLGPMFENDPTIDSVRVVDAVVAYCTEALASLEGRLVVSPVFAHDAHHSSGILAWYRAAEDVRPEPPRPAVTAAWAWPEPVPPPPRIEEVPVADIEPSPERDLAETVPDEPAPAPAIAEPATLVPSPAPEDAAVVWLPEPVVAEPVALVQPEPVVAEPLAVVLPEPVIAEPVALALPDPVEAEAVTMVPLADPLVSGDVTMVPLADQVVDLLDETVLEDALEEAATMAPVLAALDDAVAVLEALERAVPLVEDVVEEAISVVEDVVEEPVAVVEEAALVEEVVLDERVSEEDDVEDDEPEEPRVQTLDDWLAPVELVPLVELDVEPPMTASGLPRRARTGSSTSEARLGNAEISALRAAVTTMRAATGVGDARAPLETIVRVSTTTVVASDDVPGSPAERRRWLARRHR